MTRHLALNDVEFENMTFGPGLNRDACALLWFVSFCMIIWIHVFPFKGEGRALGRVEHFIIIFHQRREGKHLIDITQFIHLSKQAEQLSFQY